MYTYPLTPGLVIFGEIAPQSVCVRYGLPIGAWMAPFVLALMYILSPVAWPTAKLLDWLLGQDHGTVYKKAGLKTLVSLHKSLGDSGQQLNYDEVTIISAVLDLKDKSVGSIMTPMDNVFTLSADDVLDEETMDILLSQGYSRIPVHHPDNDQNFVGMLLVKMLITYDPEDAKPVRDFALATLPETRAQTSCLDIVNFFQQGKSHMVLVSEYPGEDRGALGVVTLEDVIEELIGEEIIDESDVFIDIQKAIRRMAPAPRTRIPKGHVVAPATELADGHEGDLVNINEGQTLAPEEVQRSRTAESKPPKYSELASSPAPQSPHLTRRRSSATGSNAGDRKPSKRVNTAEMLEHLKHLGPSNPASRPNPTRWNTVKIKPGVGSEAAPRPSQSNGNGRLTPPQQTVEAETSMNGGIGEGLVTSAGKEASDGVQALHTGYGSIHSGSPTNERRPMSSASKATQANPSDLMDFPDDKENNDMSTSRRGRPTSPRADQSRSGSRSTIRSLRKKGANGSRSPTYTTKAPARSGSITENIIDVNGVRKVVLETTSSSSNEDEDNSGANKNASKNRGNQSVSRQRGMDDAGGESKLRGGGEDDTAQTSNSGAAKKKKRRRRKHGHGKGEQEPLLGGDK